MIDFFLYALIISFISAIFSQKYFIKKKYFDKIKNRSSHNKLATRNGGIAIFISVFLITLYFYILSNEVFDFSVLIPLGILFTVGLYDDIYQVDFKLKFIFQIIVAKIIIDQGIYLESLNGLLGIYEIPYLVGQVITIFLVVLIVNASNFSDGIDGLGITESLKAIILIIIINNQPVFLGLNFILLVVASSAIPLYYFNFKNNNKIFLGDSGSLFLGGVISIGIISLFNSSVALIGVSFPIIVIICYFYPIVDTLQVTIRRLINGNSPFKPDNNHIHHILLSKGLTHLKVVIIISGLSGILQFILLYYATSLG